MVGPSSPALPSPHRSVHMCRGPALLTHPLLQPLPMQHQGSQGSPVSLQQVQQAASPCPLPASPLSPLLLLPPAPQPLQEVHQLPLQEVLQQAQALAPLQCSRLQPCCRQTRRWPTACSVSWGWTLSPSRTPIPTRCGSTALLPLQVEAVLLGGQQLQEQGELVVYQELGAPLQATTLLWAPLHPPPSSGGLGVWCGLPLHLCLIQCLTQCTWVLSLHRPLCPSPCHPLPLLHPPKLGEQEVQAVAAVVVVWMVPHPPLSPALLPSLEQLECWLGQLLALQVALQEVLLLLEHQQAQAALAQQQQPQLQPLQRRPRR